MIFSFSFKYWIIKFIEDLPLLQILIYNNLSKFKFLFPHDKDYLALKLLFSSIRGLNRGIINYRHATLDTDEYMSIWTSNNENKKLVARFVNG